MCVYVVDSLLHSSDFCGILVWNFAFELFFQRHNQLYGIQGICAQIINK